MRLVLAIVLGVAALAAAESRSKRQATQYYPQQAQQQQAQRQSYDPYSQQAQQQQQQQQYRPQQQSQYADQGSFEQPRPQRRPQQAFRQPAQSAKSQNSAESQEEEEEDKPNPLTLLLEKSTFSCSGKPDGYYADHTVQCQAFHYCLGGAKNSFLCGEGTVFHQVHLNCVPADQDICQNSEKFFFVNEYLNKEIGRGPNNTIRYADRYYPENYVIGDPFPLGADRNAQRPQYQENAQQPQPQQQQPRPRPRPQAPAGVTYRTAAASPQAPAGVTYRQAQPQAPAGVTYRQAQPQAPAGVTYRTAAASPQAPAGVTYRQAVPQQQTYSQQNEYDSPYGPSSQAPFKAAAGAPFSFPPNRAYPSQGSSAAAAVSQPQYANLYSPGTQDSANSREQYSRQQSAVKYDDDAYNKA